MLQEADIQVIYRKESEKNATRNRGIIADTQALTREVCGSENIPIPFYTTADKSYKNAWTARSQAIVENAAPARRLHGCGRRSQHSEPGVH